MCPKLGPTGSAWLLFFSAVDSMPLHIGLDQDRQTFSIKSYTVNISGSVDLPLLQLHNSADIVQNQLK